MDWKAAQQYCITQHDGLAGPDFVNALPITDREIVCGSVQNNSQNSQDVQNWTIRKPVKKGGNCGVYSTSDKALYNNDCTQEYPFICYDGNIFKTFQMTI